MNNAVQPWRGGVREKSLLGRMGAWVAIGFITFLCGATLYAALFLVELFSDLSKAGYLK